MKYQAVKYNSREEAMAAFIKMRDRKRKWLKKTENELKELRAEVETRYGNSWSQSFEYIVNRNNPNIDRIIDDFDEFIGFFNHKPE